MGAGNQGSILAKIPLLMRGLYLTVSKCGDSDAGHFLINDLSLVLISTHKSWQCPDHNAGMVVCMILPYLEHPVLFLTSKFIMQIY